MDRPRDYRQHAAATPFLGGAAVLAAFLVAALIVAGAGGKLLVVLGCGSACGRSGRSTTVRRSTEVATPGGSRRRRRALRRRARLGHRSAGSAQPGSDDRLGRGRRQRVQSDGQPRRRLRHGDRGRRGRNGRAGRDQGPDGARGARLRARGCQRRLLAVEPRQPGEDLPRRRRQHACRLRGRGARDGSGPQRLSRKRRCARGRAARRTPDLRRHARQLLPHPPRRHDRHRRTRPPHPPPSAGAATARAGWPLRLALLQASLCAACHPGLRARHRGRRASGAWRVPDRGRRDPGARLAALAAGRDRGRERPAGTETRPRRAG